MKIGDLVRYKGSLDGSNVIGIVTFVAKRGKGVGQACTVRWSNGVTSNHSRTWLIKLEKSEDR